MSAAPRVALVTGANAGIGKEVARQLANTGRYRRIYLACRNRARADTAQAQLQAATNQATFEVMMLDVSDLASVAAAVASLAEPVDDLVMNAGGTGGKTPLALTKGGVTNIFASNLLGHVALLDGLLQAGKLRRAAVFAGSEAARGVPKLGIRRPVLRTGSVAEFAAFCDGTYFQGRKPSATLAYAHVKLVGALWMASVARSHPDLRVITMSPGNTSGTEVARDLPLPLRLLLKHILMPVVMPLLGIVQPVEEGAARFVEALDDPALTSGVFYASRAAALTGPVVDQSTIFPEIARPDYQDNASAAIHRFMPDLSADSTWS